jgi:hypothetical protein
VAEARKVRETDPVRPVLSDCLRQATDAAEAAPHDAELAELRARLEELTAFVDAFDAGIAAVVRTEAPALALRTGSAQP